MTTTEPNAGLYVAENRDRKHPDKNYRNGRKCQPISRIFNSQSTPDVLACHRLCEELERDPNVLYWNVKEANGKFYVTGRRALNPGL